MICELDTVRLCLNVVEIEVGVDFFGVFRVKLEDLNSSS